MTPRERAEGIPPMRCARCLELMHEGDCRAEGGRVTEIRRQVFIDACEGETACPVCQAVERGIAAALAASPAPDELASAKARLREVDRDRLAHMDKWQDDRAELMRATPGYDYKNRVDDPEWLKAKALILARLAATPPGVETRCGVNGRTLAPTHGDAPHSWEPPTVTLPEAQGMAMEMHKRMAALEKVLRFVILHDSQPALVEILCDNGRRSALFAPEFAAAIRESQAQPAGQSEVRSDLAPGSVASGGAGRTDAIPPSAARPASAGATDHVECQKTIDWLMGERENYKRFVQRATAEAVREACAKVAQDYGAPAVYQSPEVRYVTAQIAVAIRALPLTRLPAEGEKS